MPTERIRPVLAKGALGLLGLLVLIGAPAAPTAASADEPAPAPGWESVGFLPWGDADAGVGLHPGDEDDLAYGPHGIALGSGGDVAVVDRVGGRAMILGSDGVIDRVLRLAGRPGPAALLADGRVAALDEAEPRTVRFSDGEVAWSPPWAMPPSRLLGIRADGETSIEALDAFQHRLPLSPLPGLVAPHEPPRGVPAVDGETAVVAVRSDDRVELRFLDAAGEFESVHWAVDLPDGHRLGAVEVLAASADAAVVLIETLSTDPGPLEVGRTVAAVDRFGGAGEPLAIQVPGPVAIPHDLAALADGTVYLLRSEAAGCRLWRARIEGVSP